MMNYKKLDQWALINVSKSVDWVCNVGHVTFPLVLLVWRFLICGLIFMMAVAMVGLKPSVLTIAFICGVIIFVETTRKGIVLLWKDSRKVWSKELYRNYAAVCYLKREPLAFLRLCVLIYGVFMIFTAIYFHVWNPTAEYISFISYLAAVLLFTYVGGNIEACDPPLPDEGDYAAVPYPSAAR